MRPTFLAFAFLLGACSGEPKTADSALSNTNNPQLSFVESEGLVEATWETILPTVNSMCRSARSHTTQETCQFNISVEEASANTPNARNWLSPNGFSNIAINTALLRQFQSQHEVAFVLAHEAAHTIAQHHSNLNAKSFAGGFKFERHGDPLIELEADAIGTLILAKTGFEPQAGIALLKRLEPFLTHPSRSHPELSERLSVIELTRTAIEDGNEVTLD